MMYKLLLFLILMSSCRVITPISKNTYGLNTVYLYIESENYSKLNSTVFAKLPVPAKLNFQNTDYKIHLSYAGKSTIDDYKKNMDISVIGEGKILGRKSYRLSSQYVDKSAIRSMLGIYVYQNLDVLTPKIEPVSVYINDRYVGLYFLIEPIDEKFYEKKNQPVSSIHKAIHGSGSMELDNLLDMKNSFSSKGENDSYADLKQLIRLLNNLSENYSMSDIENFIEIDQYVRYMVATAVLHNWDGYRNNYYIYRKSTSNKFALTPWDIDKVFDAEKKPDTFVSKEELWGVSFNSHKILKQKDIRIKYLTQLKIALEKKFEVKKLLQLVDEYREKIEPAYLADRSLENSKLELEIIHNDLKKHIENWHKLLLSRVNEELKKP